MKMKLWSHAKGNDHKYELKCSMNFLSETERSRNIFSVLHDSHRRLIMKHFRRKYKTRIFLNHLLNDVVDSIKEKWNINQLPMKWQVTNLLHYPEDSGEINSNLIS